MKADRSIAMLLAAALTVPASAWAERADRGKPVQLDADSVRLDDASKSAVYEGHVMLVQGTMTIKADRIDVRQDSQGMSSGEATGKPASFRQKMDGQDSYMEGEGNRVVYDARTGILKLIGAAYLKRGNDELRGAEITYDTNTERYQASNGGQTGAGGRVHAVIRPAGATGTSTGQGGK